MHYYNVFFETTQGELQYKVSIADDATISTALPDLLTELQEKGYRLAGGSSDNVQVLFNGRSLRQDIPLSAQGVRAFDNLRIRTVAQQARSQQHAAPQERSEGSSETSVALKLLYVFVAFLPIWIIEYLALVGGNLALAAGAAVAGCGIALGLWYFTETTSRGLSELIPF